MTETNKKQHLDILKKYSKKNRNYGSDYAIIKDKRKKGTTLKNICDTHIDGA